MLLALELLKCLKDLLDYHALDLLSDSLRIVLVQDVDTSNASEPEILPHV